MLFAVPTGMFFTKMSPELTFDGVAVYAICGLFGIDK
jgi:hypothetical protein